MVTGVRTEAVGPPRGDGTFDVAFTVTFDSGASRQGTATLVYEDYRWVRIGVHAAYWIADPETAQWLEDYGGEPCLKEIEAACARAIRDYKG